ncbi:MAG TPA: HAMP domain-containing sensor histidine kinase [Acidimicrobiales bacterium]|nr:HAMP domain-containing sensor histidine kinase [Acidimicrobiales bacterium]
MVRRRGRASLGARVTAGFALSALGVSVALSLTAYFLTRRSVLEARQSQDVRQTAANALVVGDALRFSVPDLPDVLSSLETPSGSDSLLYQHGQWNVSNLAFNSGSVPSALKHAVIARNTSASLQYRLDGHAELAVGIALPTVSAAYFEVFDMEDVSRTLIDLALSLAGASVATTAVAAFIGSRASRRIVAPLRQTASAAAAIAGGRLDTRLPAGRTSELADLAESFNAMVSALEGRIQRDARFASDVSHELRSPLTTLSTSLEVLQRRRSELSDRSAQALDLLSDEVSRFQHLVEDLLEVSRFDAGAADLSLEQVDLADLVLYSLVSLNRPDVAVSIKAPDVVIRADKRRLERVLANLLANADAHGDGVTGVEVGRRGPMAYLAVDDAGPGVAPEARQVIFERFARGKAAGRRARGDGVGLGLALVYEHVRLHNGSVSVSTSPAGGARFRVELPVDVALDADTSGRSDASGEYRPGDSAKDPRGSTPDASGSSRRGSTR